MPEQQPKVERQVTLSAPREDVWEALTEPELLEQWLADEVEIDPCEGGEVVLRSEGGEEQRGHVEEVVEEERLRIRWRREPGVASQVEFLLADAAAGTRLVVVESAITVGPSGSTVVGDDRLFGLEVLTLVRGRVTLVAA
jgi:uncharacterized protein YndB with AHSA1/START domain